MLLPSPDPRTTTDQPGATHVHGGARRHVVDAAVGDGDRVLHEPPPEGAARRGEAVLRQPAHVALLDRDAGLDRCRAVGAADPVLPDRASERARSRRHAVARERRLLDLVALVDGRTVGRAAVQVERADGEEEREGRALLRRVLPGGAGTEPGLGHEDAARDEDGEEADRDADVARVHGIVLVEVRSGRPPYAAPE